MSVSQVQQLVQKIREDASLQQKVQKKIEDKPTLIELLQIIGEEVGYTFTSEDVVQYFQEQNEKKNYNEELNEDLLDGVAGGFFQFSSPVELGYDVPMEMQDQRTKNILNSFLNTKNYI